MSDPQTIAREIAERFLGATALDSTQAVLHSFTVTAMTDAIATALAAAEARHTEQLAWGKCDKCDGEDSECDECLGTGRADNAQVELRRRLKEAPADRPMRCEGDDHLYAAEAQIGDSCACGACFLISIRSPADTPQAQAGQIAEQFHEAYERLAPQFGYQTRPESAVPWDGVPEQNRALMTAVVAEVLARALTDARRETWNTAIKVLDDVCDVSSGGSQVGLLKGISALRQRAAAEEGETP